MDGTSFMLDELAEYLDQALDEPSPAAAQPPVVPSAARPAKRYAGVADHVRLHVASWPEWAPARRPQHRPAGRTHWWRNAP